jgi:hypothetical protein
MKLTSRLAQSAVLLLSAPVLMVFGLATYCLVMVGQTATAIGKAWR